jgi:hypothetical protein
MWHFLKFLAANGLSDRSFVAPPAAARDSPTPTQVDTADIR